jgi:hypothetical protein
VDLDVEYLASNLTVGAEIVDVDYKNNIQNLIIDISIAGVHIGNAIIKMKDGELDDGWEDDDREVKHYEPHVRKVTSSGSISS